MALTEVKHLYSFFADQFAKVVKSVQFKWAGQFGQSGQQ